MSTEKIKVLIVDDDKFLLNMYALKFGGNGLEVDTAVGSPDALKKMRGGAKPDILILDVVMPGIDGFELLKTLKDEKLVDKTVVVMLTNQGQTSDIERAKALGVHGYIVKASSIPSEVYEEVVKIYQKNK